MKRLCVIGIILISLRGFSQTNMESFPLQVTFNKTTNLIFPYSIKRVDIGSRDVIGQILTTADTILEIKAARKDFRETNMSVVTEDGKLHCFLISYSSVPDHLNIYFNKDPFSNFHPELRNRVMLDSQAEIILKQKHFLHTATRAEDMKFQLNGVYIQGHILWFGFDLFNYSLIDYLPGYIRFFVQDKRKSKRTAIQEIDIIPLNRIAPHVVPGGDKNGFAAAFKQFTIPKGKRLVCQVSEYDGGRFLTLRISHKAILKARLYTNQ